MTQSVINTQLNLDLSDTVVAGTSTYTISSPAGSTSSHVTIPTNYTFDTLTGNGNTAHGFTGPSVNTTITGLSDNITIKPELWSEALPDVYTVNNMCEQYPALAKAYENFKTVYKLVEQDYKGKQEEGQSEFNF
jgi:hypothetical protein|tara:strand:+ start:226 stop:627 length:402 start_codon:yes stop_codon:yes gene_type:complete